MFHFFTDNSKTARHRFDLILLELRVLFNDGVLHAQDRFAVSVFCADIHTQHMYGC